MNEWIKQGVLGARGSKRFLPPTSSRQPTFNRAWVVDVCWVLASAWLALILRDLDYLDSSRAAIVAQYVAVTGGIGALVFLWMRSGASLSLCFTTRDMFKLAQGSIAIIALASLALSSLTKLDGLPRSVFFIHMMLLLAGLVAWRLAYRATVDQAGREPVLEPADGRENILLVGANRLGLLYSQVIDEFRSSHSQIVGFLDERPNLCGRRLNGHPIVGLVADVDKISAEYETHGISINRIVIAGSRGDVADEALGQLCAFADEQAVALEYLEDVFSFTTSRTAIPSAAAQPSLAPVETAGARVVRPQARPAPLFWAIKRGIDVLVSGLLLVIAAPILALVAVCTVLDVGSPALFWQQRIGRDGSRFLIYKFRTLKAPIDRDGRPRSSEDRISPFGAFVRLVRLDELPQLFNVLIGEMSLIGPRPLLPVDQPADAAARLVVRPGITGWAQVHGGRELTPADKSALDEWYCANASPAVDLKIVFKTLQTLALGEGRDRGAVRRALLEAENARARAAA